MRTPSGDEPEGNAVPFSPATPAGAPVFIWDQLGGRTRNTTGSRVERDGPFVPPENVFAETVPLRFGMQWGDPLPETPEPVTEPMDEVIEEEFSQDLTLAEWLAIEDSGLAAIRTDFSDEAAWSRLRGIVDELEDEIGGAPADLRWHQGGQFEGWTVADILAAAPDGEYTNPLVVFDGASVDRDDFTLLAVETSGEDRGRFFRFVLSEAASIEVNWSLGNLDFVDFADSAGPDGVFRGFEG